MFSKKNKLSRTLQDYIKLDYYTSYRVLIEFKKFHKDFHKTIEKLGGSIIHTFEHIKLLCANLTPRAIYRLIEYPEVSYVSLDEQCVICGENINSINGLNDNNTFNLRGRNIKIALIDTGTFPHPDLTSSKKILAFRDFINNYIYPYDDNGHGTALSTLMCGTGAISHFKYKGIASESYLLSYKAFNSSGNANFSDILKALEFVLSDISDFGTKLLCLPFESFNSPIKHIEYFDKLLSLIVCNGVIPIMSSGSNTNKTAMLTGLANAKNIIVVSGLNNDLSLYTYSAKGNKHKKANICARCFNMNCGNTNTFYISQRGTEKVYPPKLKTPYTSYSGTSVSAAYICGICCLLLEKYPNYTFDDIAARIELCCENINISRDNKNDDKVLNVSKFLS